MPWAPGVEDRSGELRAAGMMARGAAISGGINLFTAGLERGALLREAKRKEEEAKAESVKIFASKSKATESYLKANADKFGGLESVQQFLTPDPNESPAARDARLDKMIQLKHTDNTLQEHAARQQENAMRQQQMQRDLQARQKADAELQRLTQFSKSPTGAPYSPQAIGQMEQQVQRNPFMQQAAQIREATGQSPTPEDIFRLQSLVGKNADKRVIESNTRDGRPYLMSPDTGQFQVLPDQAAQARPLSPGGRVAYDVANAKKFGLEPQAVSDANNFETVTEGGRTITRRVNSTTAQEKRKELMGGYDTALYSLDKLEQTLTADAVGVRGVVGEMVNRYPAQMFPRLYDGDVQSQRNAIRELVITNAKSLLGQSGNEISDKDMARLEKLLPSTGMDSSEPVAKSQLASVRAYFQVKKSEAEGRAPTVSIGGKQVRFDPLNVSSSEEVVAAYKGGLIDQPTAVQLLARFPAPTR